MEREEILQRILDSKIVAIIRMDDSEKVFATAEALYNGGVDVIEVTMEKRVTFNNRWLPYLLITPQLIITVVFFFLAGGTGYIPVGLHPRSLWSEESVCRV